MLKISKKPQPGRAQLFQTRLREDPIEAIRVVYTATLAHPLIDADFLDARDCKRGSFSIDLHYVVRTDGVVEVGRDPLRLSSMSRNPIHNLTSLYVGVVGGLSQEGERVPTTTPAQEEALALLEQAIADALGKPLEVVDTRIRFVEKSDEIDAELDAEEAYEAALNQGEWPAVAIP